MSADQVTIHAAEPIEDSTMETKEVETKVPESLDADMGSEPIKLVSRDKVSFEIPDRKFACISKLVAQALENDLKATEIDIPAVAAKDLAPIVEYMIHRQGTEEAAPEAPLRSKFLKDAVKDQWVVALIEKISATDKQDLYDIILAANYMDIPTLMRTGCAMVATLIKGIPVEKIKEVLKPNKELAAGADSAPVPAAAEASTETKQESKTE